MLRTVLCLLITLCFAGASAGQDTLVICPDQFRDALVPWEQLRREQGHSVLVLRPRRTADEIQTQIRRIGKAGKLKFLVLIGDVPRDAGNADVTPYIGVPTHYLPAKINTRWGSEQSIATDAPYADLDGDRLPDLAMGRIPADSAQELAAVVRKIIAFEKHATKGRLSRRMHLVAGAGNFGAVADSLIEAAARQVFQQTVPADYELVHTSTNPANRNCPPLGELRPLIHRYLCGEGLAWIYMGHGLPRELDHVPSPAGTKPLLSVEDVPDLSCGPASPIAILIACYTGAFDSQPDCLGEELLLAEHGPIAVIAATRVTMPYGNTVLGYELLRSYFRDQPAQLGEALRWSQRRLLDESGDDALRASLDMLAEGISPPPVELATERQEHVWMYHLLGDPLTHLRREQASIAQKPQSKHTTK